MEQATVTAAVQQLRRRRERISVRAVHSITGGSFRDVSRLLRDAREFLEADELASLDVESEPVKPALGKIRETLEAAKAADAEAGQASAALDVARARLQALQQQWPPHALRPEEVPESVQARAEHGVEIATVKEEIAQLERLVQAAMAEARSLRLDAGKLETRRHELQQYVIPSARRELTAAQDALSILERDVAQQLELARRRVDSQARALAAYQRELEDLIGNASEG